ncbi:MAG: GNAT family N-acetyltransferase [Lachnospiraceae bacterium]
MKSVKITKESEKFQEIERLYRAAFPREERVPMDTLLEADAPYDFIACYDGAVLCGFYSALTFGDITHILFLAVEEKLRDHGYGSQILAEIGKAYAGNRVILDVEMVDPEADNNEQREQRIAFYMRNGYHHSGISYGWRGVMYEILILDGTISEEEFWNFWDQLDEVQQNNYYFYTGSYAEKGEPGICLWKLNARNERLSMLGADTQMTRPSWVTLNERGDTLYAVREQVPMGGVYEMKALRSVENPELVEPAESSELVEPAESPELLQETEGQLRGAKKEAETSRGIAKDMTAAPILQMVKEMPSGGADPCHLSLDGRENFLMAANYTSGSLAVFALDEQGHLQGRCDFWQHTPRRTDETQGQGNSQQSRKAKNPQENPFKVNPLRQEGPHVHFSEEAGELLWSTDLGLDQVFGYQIDYEQKKLTDTGIRLQLPDGYGPRHLAFWHEDMAVIYVLCELSNRIVVFAEKVQEEGSEETEKAAEKKVSETGTEKMDRERFENTPEYTILQDISTLPEGYHGESTASAIRLYGGFLFAANRGDDSIAMYEIQKDGTLTLCCIKKTGGRTPRDFQIFSDYLVVANQESDSLTVLHINRKEKRLERTAIHADVIKPTCVCRLERQALL